MKKRVRQLIEGTVIMAVTLIIGGGVTGILFNFSDTLTRTQTRILFAAYIVIMLAVGGAALYIYEARESRKYKEQLFRERHEKRIQNEEKRMSGIEAIISMSNYAA